jgi:hypothetical protein
MNSEQRFDRDEEDVCDDYERLRRDVKAIQSILFLREYLDLASYIHY